MAKNDEKARWEGCVEYRRIYEGFPEFWLAVFSMAWYNKQLLDEAEYDMKNYADRGECYPPKPKAEADNTIRDLHNSSYHTKAKFNNCFIIHSKYFQSSKCTKWI